MHRLPLMRVVLALASAGALYGWYAITVSYPQEQKAKAATVAPKKDPVASKSPAMVETVEPVHFSEETAEGAPPFEIPKEPPHGLPERPTEYKELPPPEELAKIMKAQLPEALENQRRQREAAAQATKQALLPAK